MVEDQEREVEGRGKWAGKEEKEGGKEANG